MAAHRQPDELNVRWKTMEPMVITMAREYAAGGIEVAQRVADIL